MAPLGTDRRRLLHGSMVDRIVESPIGWFVAAESRRMTVDIMSCSIAEVHDSRPKANSVECASASSDESGSRVVALACRASFLVPALFAAVRWSLALTAPT